MSTELRDETVSVNREGATVIVGAGTMGLFLAHEMMKNGKKILLIEAGNDHFHSFHSNEFENIGLNHNGIAIGRTKGIGGTTNLWGGQLAEFIECDIERRGDFGQPVWPITWDELNDYYKRIYEKFEISIHKGQAGIEEKEVFGESENGNLELFYTRWLKQPNFKFHFLNDLAASASVEIYKNAIVTGLYFEKGKCSSIDLIRNNTKERIEGFKDLVMANGTLEICRLLLISKKFPNCPFADNKCIGKYFQDHINMHVGRLNKPTKKLFSHFTNIIRNGEKLQPKIRYTGSGNGKPYLGISCYFSFDGDVSGHIDNFKQFYKAVSGQAQQKSTALEKIKLFSKVLLAAPQIVPVIYNYFKNNRIYVPFTSSVTINLQVQQISIKNSEITLSETEVDHTGRPRVVLNWQLDGREFEYIKKFCFELKEKLVAGNFGVLEFENWFKKECSERDGSWFSHVTDIYHQAGGTIMSTSGDEGVVDRNLQMHNTENVFICGASVMPTSGYANTTLTALALTKRLADYLNGSN